MSRKHYVAIAAMIRRRVDADATVGGHSITREIAEGLADVFADDNPRFDRARFLTACGIGA